MISQLKFQRGVTHHKCWWSYLFSAYRLIVHYICTKFPENVSKSFGVIGQTRFVTDRQTNGQTDRQLWVRHILNFLIVQNISSDLKKPK